MDVDLYLEVRQLFQTKWDPAVLDVLAERPCRYLALVRRLRRTVDDQLVDAHVTRSLARLQNLGLVAVAVVAEGSQQHNVYCLTSGGRHALETYRSILRAYSRAQSRAPDGAQGHERANTGVPSGMPPRQGTKKPEPDIREDA